MKKLIKHLRESNVPHTTLVALNENGVTKIGWSKRHQNHEVLSFSKKKGIMIATNRAEKGIVVLYNGSSLVTEKGRRLPDVLIEALPAFVERVEAHFGVAVVNFVREN